MSYADLKFDNYQAKRKEVQKKMNEFISFYVPHCKEGHKEIYEEKMGQVLAPLKNLIYINNDYN